MWLPFWLASTKPAASSRRLISRKGCGLRRPDLDLDSADPRSARGLRGLEMKFQRLLQIGESLFFGFALTGDIHFKALGDVPVSLSPDSCSEPSLHLHILSQTRLPSAGAIMCVE
jgi:hypothetical protein